MRCAMSAGMTECRTARRSATCKARFRSPGRSGHSGSARRSMRSCTRKHGTAGIGNRIKSQILRFDLPPPLRRRRGRARELFESPPLTARPLARISPPSRERHSIRAWSLTSCEDRPQLQRIRVDDFEASPRLKSGDHERERSRHRFNTHPTSKSTAKTIPAVNNGDKPAK